MKIRRIFLAVLTTVMLIIGISVPVSAADNCFTLGLGPIGLGVEYERTLFDTVTIYSEGGALMGNYGYSLGINYYFSAPAANTPCQGFYTGLNQAFVHDLHGFENFAKGFREDMGFTPLPPSDYNLSALTLGYKKIFNSGFAVGFLVYYGQAQDTVLYGFRVTSGYAIRW